MPPSSVPPVRRRGAFSAEPVSEEDATSYVKKVKLINLHALKILTSTFFTIRLYLKTIR